MPLFVLMLAVISPAKTLDFESACPAHRPTLPDHLDASGELVRILRKKSRAQLRELMGISPNLADLNFERFRDWTTPFSEDNARAALFAFKGDVYTGFTLASYTKRDLDFAQKHLRILSGLYGTLRPLDLIQPYRLEMGTSLKTPNAKNLCGFWGNRITESLNAALAKSGSTILVNLASKEYFSAVQPEALRGSIVTPHFKEYKDGDYKIVSLFAKKARGMMSDFLIKSRATSPEDLKSFNGGGYRYRKELSDVENWIFTRGEPA